MNHSESINELAAALAKAQGAMGGALKDSANPFFKSKYADLESVWTACRKPLSDNELAVIQTAENGEGVVRVITMLVHSSGQWMRSELLLHPKDDGPQAFGSCTSYGRRYGLAAMVGVFQSDDDGEAAQGRKALSVAETVLQNEGDDPEVRKRAEGIADRMRTALGVGIDEAVAELHDELNRDQSAYICASALLKAGERDTWKKAVKRARPAHNGRS